MPNRSKPEARVTDRSISRDAMLSSRHEALAEHGVFFLSGAGHRSRRAARALSNRSRIVRAREPLYPSHPPADPGLAVASRPRSARPGWQSGADEMRRDAWQ